MNLKKVLHIILLLFVFVYANGQDVEETVVEEVQQRAEKKPKDSLVLTDKLLIENSKTTNKLYERSFENNFQEKYVGDEFNYSKTKPKISLWERIKRKMRAFFEYLFPDVSKKEVNRITEGILYVLYVILLGAVIFILTKVLKTKKGNWFFSKKNVVVNPEVNPLEEDIHEIDFPTMILQYEQAENYRMAVRYQFLLVLKNLTDNDKINWHIEKTNSDYLKEFTDNKDRKQFEKISRIFDYVWYGEFPVDKAKYESLIPEFQFFKNTEI
ncbi:MAG: hypothetical protein KGV44_01245 [Flavobacteriaceae bacterium]|nr:hypothetical protein [Flavobacteriaceae bacterium]